MVFFTCNHCGESAKKATVEKHYQFKCRGAPIFLTCIDCLKDFRDQEYVAHTKCITEEEKYSGKDYVARPGQNKGERKQEAWTEMVRKVIETKSANIRPDIRGILNKLANYDNVPRKQAKFKNFLVNSFRLRRDEPEIIWNLIESEIKNENQPPPTVATPIKVDVKKEEAAPIIENGEIKKSKKKQGNLCENINKENPKQESVIENGKSKKQKQLENGTEKSLIIENGKSKKQKQLENGTETSSIIENGERKQSKKRKNKENVMTEVEEPPTKKKITEATNSENNNDAVDTNEIKKFCWKEQILNTISGKSKIKLEKLQKKVLKNYLKITGTAAVTEKANKKFLKKLKHMANLTVNDDYVELKEQ